VRPQISLPQPHRHPRPVRRVDVDGRDPAAKPGSATRASASPAGTSRTRGQARSAVPARAPSTPTRRAANTKIRRRLVSQPPTSCFLQQDTILLPGFRAPRRRQHAPAVPGGGIFAAAPSPPRAERRPRGQVSSGTGSSCDAQTSRSVSSSQPRRATETKHSHDVTCLELRARTRSESHHRNARALRAGAEDSIRLESSRSCRRANETRGRLRSALAAPPLRCSMRGSGCRRHLSNLRLDASGRAERGTVDLTRQSAARTTASTNPKGIEITFSNP
jgi:hypothetical protein